MAGTVVIDCFHESLPKYRNGYAIVAVDVIRATTTAVTAAVLGRECYAAGTLEEATSLAETLEGALLVGELGGNVPYGFDLHNSPSELERRTDRHRPVVLLTTSGTRLIREFRESEALYVACLRNFEATASHLQLHHPAVALIGAGTRNEFREEDQLCCAWIADRLLRAGYRAEDEWTSLLVERWKNASPEVIRRGNSAAYLRNTGQERDLEYILAHLNDIGSVFAVEDGRVTVRTAGMLRSSRGA